MVKSPVLGAFCVTKRQRATLLTRYGKSIAESAFINNSYANGFVGGADSL
jgi:hypothetical protein